ncbi:hypothetical protein DUI87_10714 [Hirundo rustica rustica]|uniref:Uncharacterized protein n=1 Tax=Hirundo rustica rustica TaxID=333673 RepID=A0A3M0KKL0_HIRRU|nr:hypothetical protein DUI87_10714 [Hirundo rustica rustica]
MPSLVQLEMLCLMLPRTGLALLAARALLTHVQPATDQDPMSLSMELLFSMRFMVSSREGTRKITSHAQIAMDYLDLRGEVAEEKIDISARQVRRRQWARNYTPSSNTIHEKVTLPPP